MLRRSGVVNLSGIAGIMKYPLAFHFIPLLLSFLWIRAAYASSDRRLWSAVGLWIVYHYPWLVKLWFYARYKEVVPAKNGTLTSKDVTAIIPTVYEESTYKRDGPGLSDIGECILTCILTQPARIIIVTDTNDNSLIIKEIVSKVTDGLNNRQLSVPIEVVSAGIADKRSQLVTGIRLVKTSLVWLLDDHVFLRPGFLHGVMCVFEDVRVGLCGTRKIVRRQVPKSNATWEEYWEVFLSAMGTIYIDEQNFDVQATSTADGGVFCVSGRSAIIRSSIVQHPEFISGYLGETCLGEPLGPGDDNFVTYWVKQHNYEIKTQCTEETTVETVLGRPEKFIGQCLRWMRTRWRSSIIALLMPEVWLRHPWTVWTTFIPSLYDISAFQDFGLAYLVLTSKFCLESGNRQTLLFGLGLWIYFSKIIKCIGHFRSHSRCPPQLFTLLIYPGWVYFLSALKLYALFTCYDTSWTGRKFSNQGSDTVGFAFDVDGVLSKGDEAIQGAGKTIRTLQQRKIPFILLTNGGGRAEKEQAATISKRLGLEKELRESQLVQSHTPFRDLVTIYGGNNVLVVGGHDGSVKDIVMSYGFKNVFTLSEIYNSDPDIHPFDKLTGEKHRAIAAKTETPKGMTPHKIDTILVVSYPHDFGLALQVSVDVLKYGGTGATSPNNRRSQIKLFFSHSDLEWKTQHANPRLAQGAFKTALSALWKDLSGNELKYSTYGKPTRETFQYGEAILLKHNESLNEENRTNFRIKTVYMIGDNPESDIKGANGYKSRAGIDWKSVLVETGLYVPGSRPPSKPTYHALNVQDAVELALKEEEAK
ncbi:hypothetical protein NUW58_g545 [Xylaria curta]|uniref:Uncharacterized protein n=1 Tax=Xylaria curta TaxID=42375 RepID=A0ACC1PRL6_9PEZI|nr:hypothetical protein NUW58_g545 [Xylaria curta]